MNYERLSRDSAEASVQISSRAEPQPKLESTHKTHGNHNPQFLYPTQQVAESTMFFTRPSVSQSVSHTVNPVFLVSVTPLKPLNRISWNFVVMKDIICRCAYLQEMIIQFFFLGVTPFMNLEIRLKWKILFKTVCQHNSSETAKQNFVKRYSNEGHNV